MKWCWRAHFEDKINGRQRNEIATKRGRRTATIAAETPTEKKHGEADAKNTEPRMARIA